MVGRNVFSGSQRRYGQALGFAGVLDGLGHSYPERPRQLLRPHQLSPGHGLAALHRMGLRGRIPHRASTGRLDSPGGKREPHLGPGSRQRNRTALRQILPAAWTQHRAPAMVIRDDHLTDRARAVWAGVEFPATRPDRYAITSSDVELCPGVERPLRKPAYQSLNPATGVVAYRAGQRSGGRFPPTAFPDRRGTVYAR